MKMKEIKKHSFVLIIHHPNCQLQKNVENKKHKITFAEY